MLGSKAEIAATARRRIAFQTLDIAELLFVEGFENVPVLERFRAAADATELEVCKSLTFLCQIELLIDYYGAD